MNRTLLILGASTAFAATMPLRFEPNRGQAPSEALFVGRSASNLFAVTANGLVVGNSKLEFNCAGGWRGDTPAPSKATYIRAAKSLTVEQFERVRCIDTAPGIDAIFYENARGEFEYDLHVSPHADVKRVAWKLHGDLKLRPPVASQDGRIVEVKFERHKNTYTFHLGKYDASKPLIIDPVMTFGTYLGGVGGGTGEGVTLDKDGNIYITGVMNTNFFPVKNALQEFFLGSNDVFISKFAPGGELIWSTYLGSYADDRGLDIAVDKEGAVYITGFTASPEFPVTPGAYQTNYGGGAILNGGDAFVSKISPDGSQLLWSTFLGGTADEYARSLVVASDGSVIVTGSTTSLNFPLARELQNERSGPRDIFVSHISADGSQLLFSTYLGGTGTDEGNGIAIDPANNVYISGTTTNGTFPLKGQAQTNYGGGTRDITITKINPFTAEMIYSTIWGGTGDDFARGIVVDELGSAYLTGYATNNTFPTRNRLRASGGGTECFVMKMRPEGNDALWVTFLGGSSTEQGFGIDIDAQKNVYVAGYTQSLNYPLVEPLQTVVGSPCRATPCTADWFLAKFRADGQQLQFSTYLGGNSGDQPRAVAVSPNGAFHIVGNSQSSTFPTANAFQPAYNGGGPNIVVLTRIEP
jgi:hypothetical protein